MLSVSALTSFDAPGAKSLFGTVLSMDLRRTVRGALASDHNSLHYDCVRCWRNSAHAFSGLLAVTGWEYEFLGSSELGIHLLSLRVLKHSRGVQTRV